MTNTVIVTDQDLIIKPKGLNKLWGLRRELRVPLSHVRGATVDVEVSKEPKGIRAPGLAFPGKYVGSFHRNGETTYWNVNNPFRNVVVQFDGTEKFTRAVITVAHPDDVERDINAAVARR